MVRDAWLPIGFSLPDGSKTKTVVHEGANWQIVTTGDGGRALIAREELANRWIGSGLIEAERVRPLGFGAERLLTVSFPSGHIVAPVSDCRSPRNKAEAIGFAISLKATRDTDAESPLQDAIYVEPWSRLLPTYTISSRTEDAVVLGYWLTGGAPIPATSFRRLRQALSWMRPRDVRDVVLAAGFAVDEVVSDAGQTASAVAKEDEVATPSPSPRKEPFSLPGRPALESFLREHVIDIIENQARYKALGIGFPSAIVLHGPPGCGKTFAVERLVEHLGWPSFQVDASSVASPYIHETSRKVAEVFESAAKSAPSVLVIDEMEAFLAERDMGSGHHRVEEVAEFLRRIPEAVANEVLIVAMTNRLDMIDPAILRRGRFDHIIEVGPAGEQEVEALISTLVSGLPREDDVDPAALGKKLAGRPLSDVAFVVREGARLAARDGKDRIGQADLLAALKATPARNKEPERRIGFV
jgi:hypothetical protein